MDRVSPCVDGYDAAGGDDAVKFFDAGGGVVGEVDVCAGKCVAKAVGGDALGWVSISVKPIRITKVGVMGILGGDTPCIGAGMGVKRGSGYSALWKGIRRMDIPVKSPPSRSLVVTFFQPCFLA